MAELEFIAQGDLPADPPYWVSAFLSGTTGYFADADGPGVTVEYSFRDSGVNGYGSTFRTMTAAEKQAAVTALTTISSYAGITFVETVDAQLQIGVTSDTAAGRPYGVVHRPGYYYYGSDPDTLYFQDVPTVASFYDKHYTTPEGLAQNGYIWLHELLHAMALDHSTSYFGNPSGIPDAEATGTTLFGRWSALSGAWKQAPMLFDIAALQYLYGPSSSQRAGNDLYVVGLGAYDPVNPNVNQTLFWDGGGTDTLDLRHSALDADVSLEAGVISRVGGATGGILGAGTFAINYGSVFEGLLTGAGADTLRGNAADNRLSAGTGNDLMLGGAGDDNLTGAGGNDVIDGGTGNDRATFTGTRAITVDLTVTGAQNTGQGRDTLISIEHVTTAAGDDHVTGNALRNVLQTGDGADTLIGDRGNDLLNGGQGNDRMTGGLGRDTFVFSAAPGAAHADQITDFTAADDTLQLDDAVFAGLTVGVLAASAFRASLNGRATDALHRVLYDTDSGEVFFDADGNGAGLRQLFATLTAGTALAFDDFLVA